MAQVDYDDIYSTFECIGLDHIYSEDLEGDDELVRLFNEYQEYLSQSECAADRFLSYVRDRLSKDYYK